MKKRNPPNPVTQICARAGKDSVTCRHKQAVGGELTCGFSLCTRLMQFEPYTTVFSGTASQVLTWQQAPMMQPLVSITFLPRSAGIQCLKRNVLEKHTTGIWKERQGHMKTWYCVSLSYLWGIQAVVRKSMHRKYFYKWYYNVVHAQMNSVQWVFVLTLWLNHIIVSNFQRLWDCDRIVKDLHQ